MILKSEKHLHGKPVISWTGSGSPTCPMPLNFKFSKVLSNRFFFMVPRPEQWRKPCLRAFDGCYTNLLKRVQNLDWRDHPTLNVIYHGLPRISSVLTSRMLSFSGHCFRAKREIISDILLWCPAGHKRSRKHTFLDVLKRETGLEYEELGTAMADRE